jgi:hypothetical protein
VDLSEADSRAAIARWLEVQARWCERLGSPLYAALLVRAAEDAANGGPVFEVMRDRAADPPGSALALRFMGSVHRLVLQGDAPALAAFYPSAGGDPSTGDPWPAFHDTVAAHVEELRALVLRPVQTNEAARSAALLGGFLTVVREHAKPLRILEVGASAGLNLRWDRYRYTSGDWSWGEPWSPVVLNDVFVDASPEPVPVQVAERAGCDAEPIDPTKHEGRLALMSYLWPDQVERLAVLAGALEVAGSLPAVVDRAEASAWLEAKLERAAPGLATVVYHSIVMQYLGEEGRARLRVAIEEAGARAADDAPLAWLRFEPDRPDGGGRFLVHLTTWPGGEERLLAESHPHGPPVRWLA